jgi:hypothetical protein
MPPVSQAQRGAMWAAASGKSTIGIPEKVGKEFAEADPGGKLPKYVGKKAEGGKTKAPKDLPPPHIHIHLPSPPPILMLGHPGDEDEHPHAAFGGPPTLGGLHLPHASEDPIKSGLPVHIKAPSMPKDAGVSGLGGMGVKAPSGGGGGGGGGMGRAGGMSMSQENPWWERSEARHLADGGMSMSQENPWWERSDANQINDIPFHQGGMIGGSGGGRTDRLPMVVGAEAHVVPADVMSALGQGNSAHGGPVLEAALGGGTGPYNTKLPTPRIEHNEWTSLPRPPPVPRGAIQGTAAEGGRTDEPTSILAASGEFVVRPDQVEALGQRAIEQGMAKKGESPVMAGHRLLDEMIAHVRKFQMEWLKHAPPPKKKDGGAVGMGAA